MTSELVESARRYTEGEVVDTHIRAATVLEVADDTVTLQYAAADGALALTTVRLVDTVEITRAAPPDWPPQVPGETWRDVGGHEWMWRYNAVLQMGEFVSAREHRNMTAEDFLLTRGPLELIHRPTPDNDLARLP